MGPLQGMVEQREIYAQAMKALSDAIARPWCWSAARSLPHLDEAARTSEELEEIGVRNQTLVINGVFTATDSVGPRCREDGIAGARQALENMPAALASFTADGHSTEVGPAHWR